MCPVLVVYCTWRDRLVSVGGGEKLFIRDAGSRCGEVLKSDKAEEGALGNARSTLSSARDFFPAVLAGLAAPFATALPGDVPSGDDALSEDECVLGEEG
mmetsp:Transcript_88126/g.161140  ORF Transcript_88126/g.161140 Transcript_88126/m.161140 type:complete len:99 (+) Transcript_88126:1013-1309(+)